jgi:4-diphosphocytidyl-2-C-methyl-D-erythritol kinase
MPSSRLSSEERPVRVMAPAKVNLHLRVGPPTADGFHPLLSWMVTVGLFDKLEFVPHVAQPGISLLCDDPAIPTDASNLIVKTASALLDERSASSEPRDRAVAGVAAALQKRIPVGAGLGGGSSDGAFTLLALNRLLGLDWPVARLSELAARFGSDLPFFLYGPSSVCTGRGEIVRPVPHPKPRAAVLVLPGIHMATPAVYRRFDQMKLGDLKSIQEQPDWLHWASLDALQLLPLLVNDLEAPALAICPELAQLRDRAAQQLGRVVRMSGSGSSLFTLFDAADEASDAARRLQSVLRVRVEAVELCPGSPEGDF